MASSFLLLVLVPTLLFSVAFSGQFQHQDRSNGWNRNWEKWLNYNWGWGWQNRWTLNEWIWWWNLYNDFGIINDVSEDAVPLDELDLQFGDENVEPGTELSIDTTLLPPSYVGWKNSCEDNVLYTLILVDLDPVAGDEGETYVHWIVNNIRGCEVPKRLTDVYSAPKPLVLTGLHRYYTGVWKQNRFEEVLEATGRLFFSLRHYTQRHGRPIAGTFYVVQFPIDIGSKTLSKTPDLGLDQEKALI